MSGVIEGFEQRRVPSDGIGIDTLVGGRGPPLPSPSGPVSDQVWT
jgi:hypothetical protein